MNIINTWEIYGDDEFFDWAGASIRLEKYGYDTYHLKVNEIFISSELKYVFGIDGRVYPNDSSQSEEILISSGRRSLAQSTSQFSEKITPKSELEELVELIKDSDLVDDGNRQSVISSAVSYEENKYCESLCLLFPSVESIVNGMLINAGKRPTEFPGLVQKIQWLEDKDYLPRDLTKVSLLFKGRNAVVHGDSLEDEFLEPICILTFRYLKKIISTYTPKDG